MCGSWPGLGLQDARSALPILVERETLDRILQWRSHGGQARLDVGGEVIRMLLLLRLTRLLLKEARCHSGEHMRVAINKLLGETVIPFFAGSDQEPGKLDQLP